MDERIIKYCQAELSKEEENVFLNEVYSNSLLKSRVMEFQHLHSLLGLQAAVADKQLGEASYVQFEQRMERWKFRRLFLKWGRYAAVFLLVTLSSWMLSHLYYQSRKTEIIALSQVLNVPAGQRAELTLPDGTKVWLNANSKLIYPSFFTKERRVTLIGEGFFNVAKNDEIPFVVTTQAVDIKAIGTQFNVYSYPESGYTEVFLQEGSLKTYFPESESEGVVLFPGQALIQEGETLFLEEKEVDELLWKEGLYVFKKQKLSSIIEKLELYFDVKIIVHDAEILNYEYIGKFRQRDGIMTILQVIQKIHKFKIDKNDELNRIVLYK